MAEKKCDEEMVRLARAGNRDAEETLLRKYKGVVKKRAASYYMAGADRDDVIQEGMIGVFKAIRDFDSAKGASFSTFAELCIIRQITDAVRAAARYKHSPLNDSMSLQNFLPAGEEDNTTLEEVIASSTSEDPGEMLVLREDLDYIEKNGGKIFSPLEQRAWEMYLEGIPYAEIARRLGRTTKTVDNAISRAKKKLKPVLRK